MNKEISVQYAYKKDGKGERHGDLAERTLAAEAKKHITQPVGQPALPLAFSNNAPGAPAAMPGESPATRPIPPANMSFANGSSIPNPGVPSSHLALPPQHTQRYAAQSQPLPPPPSGLPPRPPPSQAGYGGPQGVLPPGFGISQPLNYPSSGPPTNGTSNLLSLSSMRSM